MIPTVFPLRGVRRARSGIAAARRIAPRKPLVAAATGHAPYWSGFVNPADNQGNEPSCAGRGWANWSEAMIRYGIDPRAIPPGYQLDASSAWRRQREDLYRGDMSGGLTLKEGFLGAMKTGILPPKTVLLSVGLTRAEIEAELWHAPLVEGHAVTEGLMKPRRDNGYVDPHYPPDGRRLGYHCTLALELIGQESGALGVLSEGSWGRFDYGFHGLFLRDWEAWQKSVMKQGGLYTALLPDGWQKWRGWEKCLVRDPQGAAE